MNNRKGITYRKAGVNIDEGDRFVDLIKPVVRRTFRPEVMADIGSFGAFFRLNTRKYKDPVLVSGSDGVGTKLKIAFLADKHDTVGIDLVAMCVNDILTCGAEPLFFLDYFGTGKLKPEKAAEVIKGIAAGCLEAGCALVGGETAEMPGFYDPGEYDLAGFAVGVVDRKKLINGSAIRSGDVVIGLASNGIHSNGYSLVRKVFLDHAKISLKKKFPEIGRTLADELLRPTRIYVKDIMALGSKVRIKGMAHITGGGIPGNLPRIFPKNVGAEVFPDSWPVPPVFDMIRKLGNVPSEDMSRTFNMGLGYMIVVDSADLKKALGILYKNGCDAFYVGNIKRGIKGVKYA